MRNFLCFNSLNKGGEPLNERILAIIVSKGLKKTEFAQKLNISQAYVSQLCSGIKTPSDRTILDICREFDVNEHWLRTGEGEMFIQKSPGGEISAFVGDILRGEPDFRQRFISVLARMTTEEWKLLERKVLELAEEIKRTDPDGSAQ